MDAFSIFYNPYKNFTLRSVRIIVKNLPDGLLNEEQQEIKKKVLEADIRNETEATRNSIDRTSKKGMDKQVKPEASVKQGTDKQIKLEAPANQEVRTSVLARLRENESIVKANDAKRHSQTKNKDVYER